MSQTAFYWGPLVAIHAITIALWIGSTFYCAFGLQSCLGLLDQTSKVSVQLQSLKKLFQFNWPCSVIAIVTQGVMLIPSITAHQYHWSAYIAFIAILLMFILQFYAFTSPYRKARRALRPKGNLFDKIYSPLKILVFFGIMNLVLLAF